MGLFDDWIKAKIYGHEVRKTIREIKEEKEELNDPLVCFCGRIIKENETYGICQAIHWVVSDTLCKRCMKDCNGCGKVYCRDHMESHRC